MKRLALAAVAALMIAPGAAQAATITVDTTADSSVSQCTLRDAIVSANSNTAVHGCSAGSGADTIHITAMGQIALGSPLPDITTGLTINGLGPAYTEVHRSGGGSYRIFNVTGSPSVSLSGLMISNGSTIAGFPVGGGGGIANSGTLTLSNITLSGNSATASGTGAYAAGGAIHNTGTLHLQDSTLDGNGATATASGPGASDFAKEEGAAVMNTGTLTIDRTTIHANTGTATGVAGARAAGAISGGGTATITASTIDGNTTTASASGTNANASTWGGGIAQYNLGSAVNGGLALDRDTIAENSLSSTPGSGGTPLDRGGGIALYNNGASSITSATIAGNTAVSGASADNVVLNSTSNPTVENTIVSGPGGELNCFAEAGTFTSLGHNISSDGSCNFSLSSDRLSTDPLLRGLADNGGPTRTMGFFDYSPAKDGGDSVGATLDQRGFVRPFDWVSIDSFGGGDNGDVGALEFQPNFVSRFHKDFGLQAVGTASAPQTFTLTNDYGTSLTVDPIALIGPDAADFLLSTDSCSGNTPFEDHETCTFDVTFAPQTDSMGSRTAEARLTTDAYGHPPLPIPLTGFVPGDAPPSPQEPGSSGSSSGQSGVQGATTTGRRAAALKKCKKRKSAGARAKCRKKARALPV